MPALFAHFALSFAVAAALTPAVRALAWRAGVVDRPDGGRKLHGRPVALLGGLAVFAAIATGMAVATGSGALPTPLLPAKYLLGLLAAMTLLAVGGAWDDARNIAPLKQVVWPVAAALVLVAAGIGIGFVRNPLGGLLRLDQFSVTVLWWQGIPYKLTPLADLFTVAWLLGMTYTTKFLDGLDGLVAGTTVIGALVIAAVSMMKDVPQPGTALLAMVVAGAYAGFLLFNAAPASIFLGEGGATTAGFLLGTLAVMSGSKIATTLLVFGLPVIDAASVIIGRLARRQSPAKGDRSHLHFRLLDLGFTRRQVVTLYWFVAALLGTATLSLRDWEKFVAFGFVGSVLFAVLAVGVFAYGRRAGR